MGRRPITNRTMPPTSTMQWCWRVTGWTRRLRNPFGSFAIRGVHVGENQATYASNEWILTPSQILTRTIVAWILPQPMALLAQRIRMATTLFPNQYAFVVQQPFSTILLCPSVDVSCQATF